MELSLASRHLPGSLHRSDRNTQNFEPILRSPDGKVMKMICKICHNLPAHEATDECREDVASMSTIHRARVTQTTILEEKIDVVEYRHQELMV